MSPTLAPPAKGKKRTIEDVEEERAQVEEIVRNIKRQRSDNGAELPDGSMVDEQGANSEPWSEGQTKKLFDVLMEDMEAKQGLPLSGHDQQRFEQQLQYVSAWTAGTITEQTPATAEQLRPKTSGSPSVEALGGNIALTETQLDTTTKNASPPKNPLLSDGRPIQPVAYGQRNPATPVFPPANVLVKEDIPLPEFCAKWPNHLIGVHLRRFIKENWIPGRIFVSMHPDARKVLDKEASIMNKKGWEIIQQRLEDEKKKMAEEASTQVEAGGKIEKEASPANSKGNNSVMRTLPKLSEHVPTTSSHPQPVSPDNQAQEGHPSPLAGRAVPQHLSEHKTQVKNEVLKQNRLIHQLLQQGSDWVRLSAEEQNRRLKDAWLDRAQKYEAWLIEKFSLNTSGIDFTKVEKGETLDRQGKLLWKVLVGKYPLSPGVTASERDSHHDHILKKVYHKQLVILEEWTIQWEDELSKLHPTFPGPNGATEAGPDHSEPELPDPSRIVSRGTSIGNQYTSSMHQNQHFQHHRHEPASGSNSPFTHPGFGQPRGGGTNLGWQNELDAFLPPPPISGGYGQYALENIPYTNHIDPDPYGQSNGSFAVPGYMAYTTPNMGSVHAMKASIVSPAAVISPARSVTSTQAKKRGAPRRRMFITMPTRDTPLPPEAQLDDELILRHYPEHLSLPEVMRRFVRQPGALSSGWSTRRMVDILMMHPNSKDSPTITMDQKRENLKRWVIKERDTCNGKIRKESGNQTRTMTNSSTTTNQQDRSSVVGSSIEIPQMPAASYPQYPNYAGPNTQNMYVQPSYLAPPLTAHATYRGYGTVIANTSVTDPTSEAQREDLVHATDNGELYGASPHHNSHGDQASLPPEEEEHLLWDADRGLNGRI